MNAILWDGNKQLHGFIEFTDMELIFRLKDFSETSLHLVLKFAEITKIGEYKLYNLSNEGIEICSTEGKRNVFVVEDVDKLRTELNSNLQITK